MISPKMLVIAIVGIIIIQAVPTTAYPKDVRNKTVAQLEETIENFTTRNASDYYKRGENSKNGTEKTQKNIGFHEFKGGLSIFERFDGTPFSFYYQSLDKPKKSSSNTKNSSPVPSYFYYLPIFAVVVIGALIVIRLVSWMNTDYQKLERTNIVIMLPEESSTHIVYTKL